MDSVSVDDDEHKFLATDNDVSSEAAGRVNLNLRRDVYECQFLFVDRPFDRAAVTRRIPRAQMHRFSQFIVAQS